MLFGRRRSRFAECIRSTVVLHLQGGESIAGVLLGEYDDVYALARARVLNEANGRLQPIDGEVLIRHDRVRFAQVGVRIDDIRELALAPAEGSRGG